MIYYIESLSWNVAGQEIWPVLCRNDLGLTAWKQDFEHRVYWTPIEHSSPRACLETARGLLPNAKLYLDEKQNRILIVDDEDCVVELYRITREN